MRTSAAIAPSLLANTGFRSISEISGKSLTSWLTRTMMSHSASRFDRVAAAHALEHFGGLDAVEHRQRVFAGWPAPGGR